MPGANWDLCLDIGTVAERLIERDEKIGNRHFACKPISQSALQRQTKSQITGDFQNCKQITPASKQLQFDPQLTLKMVPDVSKEMRKLYMCRVLELEPVGCLGGTWPWVGEWELLLGERMEKTSPRSLITGTSWPL